MKPSANPEEDFEELLKKYASPAQINEALNAKESDEDNQPVGEQVKHYPKPQRELDLHGKTASEAIREIGHFLQNARYQRIRTVRIITGKGLHSPDLKSVLPEMTEKKLAELKRAGSVLAFKREKGGGAFLVYLK